MKVQLAEARLYGIVDLGYVATERVEEVARDLCLGGVDVLQLRAKGWKEHMLLPLALSVAAVAREYGVVFFINDFPHLAVACGADGVHIGQDDGSLAAARKIVGAGMLVGRSTHSPEQALAALAEGFDCIGFGPVFPTPTKAGRPAIGLADIAAMELAVGQKIPMFCIGGIKTENWSQVRQAGAKRIVVVSGLLQAEDVQAEARSWMERLRKSAD